MTKRQTTPHAAQPNRPATELDRRTTLLLHAQKGSAEAFQELIEDLEKEIWIYAFMKLRDEFAAGEVVNQAALRMWDNLQEYDPAQGRAGTWAYAIAENLIKDWLRAQEHGGADEPPLEPTDKPRRRRKQTHTVGADGFDHLADGQRPPHAEADRAFVLAGIRAGLKKLSPRYRLALELMYFQGLDRPAIATALGCSENATSSVLTRARQELAEQVSDELRDLV